MATSIQLRISPHVQNIATFLSLTVHLRIVTSSGDLTAKLGGHTPCEPGIESASLFYCFTKFSHSDLLFSERTDICLFYSVSLGKRFP